MNGKPGPTIALVMIVKNEEHNLARSLGSVADICDEMIVVDTGSTDGSRDLAESLGAKVLEFEWCDDFSAPRNAGLDAATSDWILQLDADEELASGAEDLSDLLRDKYVWAYHVRLVLSQDVDSIGQAKESSYTTRLFRNNGKVRYRYPIHEYPYCEELDRHARCEVVVNHFGPAVDPNHKDRFARNVPLLEKAIAEFPDTTRFQFYLGMEHWNRQDYDSAFPFFKAAAQEPAAGGEPERHAPSAARNMAWCAHKMGQSKLAVEILQTLQKGHPRFTDAFYLEGKLRAEAGDRAGAVRLFQRCIQMGDPPGKYLGLGGTGTWRPRQELGENLGSLS